MLKNISVLKNIHLKITIDNWIATGPGALRSEDMYKVHWELSHLGTYIRGQVTAIFFDFMLLNSKYNLWTWAFGKFAMQRNTKILNLK